MTDNIRWSVIVPSHNGGDTLRECLASLATIATSTNALEFILVDNDSTDETAMLMMDFAARAPAIVLSEPRPGKSHALNTAIERARGEMLLFLDDDVIADASLIEAYTSAWREFPEAAALAGQIRPYWQAPPPNWLRRLSEEGLSCGCTPAALEANWIAPTQVKGGNMCFSRAAIGDTRFSVGDVNFRGQQKGIGGTDTEFARRAAGHRGIGYVPAAKVLHVVSAQEMRWRVAFSRYLRIGRGSAAQGLMRQTTAALALKAAAYGIIAIVSYAIGARTTAARNGLRSAMQIGALDYLVRHSRPALEANAKDHAGETPPANRPGT